MDGTAGNITALERELITLVRKSVEQPMRLIPSDLDPVRDFVGDDALRQEGYDDLGILDLSIAIADANMWARFYRLLDLEAGLFYLTSGILI